MSRTAIFAIDIQNGLANSATEIPHAPRIRQAAETILSSLRARSSGPDIFIVQHEEGPESGDLVRSTEPWELVFPPRGEEEKVVYKHTCNTLDSNPDLINQLRAQEIGTLVMFGIQSEFCVRETSLGALAAGFKVIILQGAHSTYDDSGTGKSAMQIEREVEEEVKANGGIIIPWEKWLEN
ncbi:conserved hypothetical protein [Talaromyces stipitatus ATCC 10500]|uniref:Isochorismatase-like domain-containing protein n=1 Tax=Talaromyces stipitatus (strain ATCC 10500 / CBS 375.48 / QM 6759 / NRRL 1006) TaxID=441959 RepID=B8MGZ1_TALSN|nr:uncharacterized protein TSTA_014640 [Talaromyces stipitatus ATCC 10500]EED16372.1 conserved hypothetical protein [Talaromyces stipitatus ATCC 10500]